LRLTSLLPSPTSPYPPPFALFAAIIEWLKYQPIIALFIAKSFITVGYILLKDTQLAFRIAKWSIFCYILLAIGNSVAALGGLSYYLKFRALLSVLGSTIIMGIFLVMAINNHQGLSSTPPEIYFIRMEVVQANKITLWIN
jgi:hypothetical protein